MRFLTSNGLKQLTFCGCKALGANAKCYYLPTNIKANIASSCHYFLAESSHIFIFGIKYSFPSIFHNQNRFKFFSSAYLGDIYKSCGSFFGYFFNPPPLRSKINIIVWVFYHENSSFLCIIYCQILNF